MSKNISVGTRKIANYGWPDRSQKKFWWKIDLGADVQIAHPSCLQGRKTNRAIQQLVSSEVSPRIAEYYVQFNQVKRMIRGYWKETFWTYSQTINRLILSLHSFFDEKIKIKIFKWAIFGKQNWRCGMNRSTS